MARAGRDRQVNYGIEAGTRLDADEKDDVPIMDATGPNERLISVLEAKTGQSRENLVIADRGGTSLASDEKWVVGIADPHWPNERCEEYGPLPHRTAMVEAHRSIV
jgi:hypothetical protein